MPHLQRAGHEVGLWHEVDTPADYDRIPIPADAPAWSVADLGLEPALAELANWRPNLLYAHGLLDPDIERRTLDVAPAVFFAHDYYGTCISGSKTFTRPIVQPCDRRFGWQCLGQYYSKRCGGLSPMTMFTQFSKQRDRLELLGRYAAIVTHSTHMQAEYIKHGLAATRVFKVRYGSKADALEGVATRPRRDPDAIWHLLFVGRMDRLKGGSELLRALPQVAQRTNRPLRLTL